MADLQRILMIIPMPTGYLNSYHSLVEVPVIKFTGIATLKDRVFMAHSMAV
jgi:hypothetical protein